MPHVLLDTGPLVAALDRRDAFHEWAAAQLDVLTEPLLTCEPVLTEACHLVRKLPHGAERILALVERDVVRIQFRLSSAVQSVQRLMIKYADVPMSLADACLVRMAELHPDCRVFTLDAGFRRYRRHRRRAIPLIFPEGHQ